MLKEGGGHGEVVQVEWKKISEKISSVAAKKFSTLKVKNVLLRNLCDRIFFTSEW